jgi:serine/threonine protein kinase/Tfp pilus assembly protein PilF
VPDLPAEARPETCDAVDGLAAEMARRWRAGDRPAVEELLADHPDLADRPAVVLELLAEEVRLREEAGDAPRLAELQRRFPRWRREVRALLECHRLLGAPLGQARFPAAGETLGDFRLLSELGRGASGRVFLAAQSSLADRPVVLKLAQDAGDEHLSLSRLQHTHIVPLHSAHEFPEHGLRGLCQPYFGGVPLSRLLQELEAVPPAARSGLDLLAVLERTHSSGSAMPVAEPVRRFLARATSVQAVCWIGACLADALQYAHERGLVHLDLKPANVLLAGDGQPMLLDFHLARPPLAAGSAAPGLGGTPGYMAPEQERALTAAARRQPLPAAVDHRADVHALGVLLYGALGGSVPPPARRAERELRRRNPAVTPGLADLLGRCLAADPAARYGSAAALADDLRRHLADLPLRGVANRSPLERWRKWRRRHPTALAALPLLLIGLAVVTLLPIHLVRQSRGAEAELRAGERHLRERHYRRARDAFRHGEELAEGLPFGDDLRRHLREGMRQAELGETARDLHALCDRLRPLYGTAALAAADAHGLADRCRQLWRCREPLAAFLSSQGTPEADGQARDDLLDLAVLWTDFQVAAAAGVSAAVAREEALTVLDEAEALLGPSCVLARERQAHALALGRTEVAAAAARQTAEQPPRTAWEYYALGRADLRADDLEKAAAHLERAVRLQPQALWPHFHAGLCAHRQGRHDDALVEFSACVALAPDSAPCVYNRGRAQAELNRLDRALADYDRALELDPGSAAVALSRAHLHCRAGRLDAARADLDRARRNGAAAAEIAYHEAVLSLARQDQADAREHLKRALRLDPGHAEARRLLRSLPSAP